MANSSLLSGDVSEDRVKPVSILLSAPHFNQEVLRAGLPDSMDCNTQFLRVDPALQAAQNGRLAHPVGGLDQHRLWSNTSWPLRFLGSGSFFRGSFFTVTSTHSSAFLEVLDCWHKFGSGHISLEPINRFRLNEVLKMCLFKCYWVKISQKTAGKWNLLYCQKFWLI